MQLLADVLIQSQLRLSQFGLTKIKMIVTVRGYVRVRTWSMQSHHVWWQLSKTGRTWDASAGTRTLRT
jgi:hypothetical protein